MASGHNPAPRGLRLARVLRTVVTLAQRPYSIRELAVKLYGCEHLRGTRGECACQRLTRRDLVVIELAGIPVMQDDHNYSVDPHFMRRFI